MSKGFVIDDLYNDEPFEAEFKAHEGIKDGKGLKVTLNQDIVSLDFLEQAANSIKNLLPKGTETPEVEGEIDVREQLINQLEALEGTTNSIRVMARILGGKPGENNPNDRVIRSWNLITNDKKAVPVSFEVLSSWKFSVLNRFYRFCVYEASAPTKKSETQSAST